MPTLQSIRSRMIDIHNSRPGMSTKAVHAQVMRELGYSFPLKYIENKIYAEQQGVRQWKEGKNGNDASHSNSA